MHFTEIVKLQVGKKRNTLFCILLLFRTIVAKTQSTRIRIFLNPHFFLSGYENIRVHTLSDHSVFRSNSPVHTYSNNSLRIHSSTQD